MKKVIYIVVALAVALTGLTACGTTSRAEAQDEYYGICVDPNTEVRLPDAECADAELDSYEDYQEDGSFTDGLLVAGVLWFVLANSGKSYPAVGQKVSNSSVRTSLPKSAKYRGTGLKSYGGTIEKVKPKKSSSYKKKSSGSSNKSKSRSSGKRR